MARLTQPYKNTSAHRQRAISTESPFASGMKYTHLPIGDGYARTLVNFKIHNDGESLRPRGGLKALKQYTPLNTTSSNVIVYANGTILVANSTDTDTASEHFIIFGQLDADGVKLDKTWMLLGDPEHGVIAQCSTTNTSLKCTETPEYMHGMPLTEYNTRKGINCIMNGTLYALTASNKLVYIDVQWSNEYKTEFTWDLVEVEAKEPNPSMTINYGYNMLKSNPYTFTNKLTATGALTALGVVPYDASGNLLLSARAGQEITFNLVYQYPQKHVTNSDTYRYQIELQDNDAGTSAEVIIPWSTSPVVHPADDIKFTITPTIKSFTLIARLYVQSDIDDQLDEWDNNDNLQQLCKREEFVTPESVTTLASYHLTDETDTTAKNLKPIAYDLTKASGMCTWQQRLVVWGVPSAMSTVWVSDINDVTYFPYPNNVEIFSNDIVACVPYMSDLLVLTKNDIWRLTLNEDGLSFKLTKVQDNVSINLEDSLTVTTVQNMVFFKNDDKFYMIVPNYSFNTGVYGVQMAPISRPIEQLFSSFSDSVYDIVNAVYGLEPNVSKSNIAQSLLGYNCYVDNTEIHNVYKLKYTRTINTVSTVVACVDVHIIYNTVLRAWTIDMYNTDSTSMYVAVATSTDNTKYFKPVITDNGIIPTVLAYDDSTTVDSDIINNKYTINVGNRQYIDTGNRDFAEDLKKRFREVQFCVNILERGTLNFNTGFIVDDTPEISNFDWDVQVDDDTYLSVARVERENVGTPDLTSLNFWRVSEDQFPDVTMFKVRYHVCGKGYNGSAQIISDNAAMYELRHISFVYRQMFAR